MRVEIEGEEFEIPDADVLAYAEGLATNGEEDFEVVPPNKFLFGVHVKDTSELKRMGADIAAFIDKLGGGEMEIQVSVNAKLAEPGVIGFHQEPAIGYMEPTEADEWDDEEEEGDDD